MTRFFVLQRHRTETIRRYSRRMMNRFSNDSVDERLDAEDCSLHCPGWFHVFLAGLGLFGLIGYGILG